MVNTEQERPAIRFGAFELDTREGELRKHGVRVKLQQKPLQVLTILLERAGEVVTREEIQKRLWPGDTYVDFDNAMNSAVRKLREVLGDTADNPRFIETLSRRGYRFGAPVSFQGLMPEGPPLVAPEAAQVVVPRRGRWRLTLMLATSVASVITITASLAFWFLHRSPGTGAPDTLLTAFPFTSYPGFEVMPSFSPDGTRIAFAWQKPGEDWPDVYVKLIGPGEPVKLSSAGGFAPAWSHDGRFIAFLRAFDILHAALMVVPVVGGAEREVARLTFASLHAAEDRYFPMPYATWSPDDKWILTLEKPSASLSHPNAIIRVSVESGEKRVLWLGSPDTIGNGGLALAPDGKTLAFSSDSGFWARDIYVVPVTGDLLFDGKPRRLTFDHNRVLGLAWTGDGKQLVFSSARDGRVELWRIAPERGSRPVRLNLTNDETIDVAISRDGKHLVYAHSLEDQNIWRASLAGGRIASPTNLISSARRDTQPQYSPDGSRIAFESNRSGNEEIWACKADGSKPVQLTSFGDAWAGAPKWSPDGNRIAFAANAGGNWNIYTINSGGGKPTRLTGDGADESWPSWSRDGKWIYYFSTRGKEAQIWKMPAAGGTETQVTKTGGYWSEESSDGKDLYVINDHGVWRIPLTGGTPVQVQEQMGSFSPRRNGVYVDKFVPQLSGSPLFFVDSRTKRTVNIGLLPGRQGWGMNVSPDERWVIYARFDREGSELMMINDFH